LESQGQKERERRKESKGQLSGEEQRKGEENGVWGVNRDEIYSGLKKGKAPMQGGKGEQTGSGSFLPVDTSIGGKEAVGKIQRGKSGEVNQRKRRPGW